MTDNNSEALPLEGVKVVSLEQAIAAPLCTRHLAEQGARVIKVERPGTGDFARQYDARVRGMSSHFVWANRSKESLSLDLKSSAGLDVLFQLLAEADVLVQNLAPGAADRMGLSFRNLHQEYPRLIVCDISGYGFGGPLQDKKAYDLLIQSESGFLSVTGTPGPDGMVKAGCSVADIAAGMYAQSNILSALMLRHRTGTGSHIDVSMLESLVEWMGYPMYYSFEEASAPPRAGASHATIFPYGPFPVGDGNTLMLGLKNEREWREFCTQVLQKPDLTEHPRFATNSQRSIHRDELGSLIREAFSGLSLKNVTERLDAAGIANASVNDMQKVWSHPQLRARDRWIKVKTPVGEVPALKPPGLWFAGSFSAVPDVGEHSRSILSELGYGEEQIGYMEQQGVI